MTVALEQITISIVIGTLAAIVYSLRVLVLMERRVQRIEIHIENLASRILAEEIKIQEAEEAIQEKLGIQSKKPSKSQPAKKTKKK